MPPTSPWRGPVRGIGGRLGGLWTDEGGTTTVEYALLLVVIAIAALAAWDELGRGVNDIVKEVEDIIRDAVDG